MSQTSTLDDFENQKRQSKTQSEENTDTNNTPPPIDDLELPHDYPWGDEYNTHHATDAVQYLPLRGDIELDLVSNSFGYTFKSNDLGYVATGVDKLKDTSETEQRVIPPSAYNSIDDFDTVRISATTTFSRGSRGAWGINNEHMEAAIRFVTGGGSYRAADLKITALDKEIGFLISYRGHDYLFSYDAVSPPSEDEIVSSHTVAGMEIRNEDNERVLDGIEIMVEEMGDYGIQIDGFVKRTNSNLVFRASDGKTLSFSGRELQRFTHPTRDLSEYEGTQTIQMYHRDGSVEYTWGPDATKYKPGEVIDHGGTKRYVIGYTMTEKRMRSGPFKEQATVAIRVLATAYTVSITEKKDKYDVSIPRSNTSECIEEIILEQADTDDPESFPDEYLWTDKETFYSEG